MTASVSNLLASLGFSYVKNKVQLFWNIQLAGILCAVTGLYCKVFWQGLSYKEYSLPLTKQFYTTHTVQRIREGFPVNVDNTIMRPTSYCNVVKDNSGEVVVHHRSSDSLLLLGTSACLFWSSFKRGYKYGVLRLTSGSHFFHIGNLRYTRLSTALNMPSVAVSATVLKNYAVLQSQWRNQQSQLWVSLLAWSKSILGLCACLGTNTFCVILCSSSSTFID